MIYRLFLGIIFKDCSHDYLTRGNSNVLENIILNENFQETENMENFQETEKMNEVVYDNDLNTYQDFDFESFANFLQECDNNVFNQEQNSANINNESFMDNSNTNKSMIKTTENSERKTIKRKIEDDGYFSEKSYEKFLKLSPDIDESSESQNTIKEKNCNDSFNNEIFKI
ncbi:hypothetical protein A0H76_1049 [Hepatospora eriocheir]|uniref:Uncharacterized protein n=1 Tax=Hepatospora eriocheir TaxID=1081669 RepID=A0A1X0QHS5_9MICR|nr:hypothetical protein A0H76_1049 [Hepatospora eriocheir]